MPRFLSKALFIASIIAVLLAPVASAKQHAGQNFASAPTPTPGLFQAPAGQDGTDEEVLKAIQAAIQLQREAIPAYEIYATQVDHLRVDAVQGWASAWLNPLDPQTGRVVPAEPGLALARHLEGQWQMVLPGAAGWEATLQAAPDSILPSPEKGAWLETAAQARAAQTTNTFSGYRLPWESGKTMYLTQSVHHDAYTPSGTAHFAFDFAAPYDASQHGSPMFAIHAAKAGAVVSADWHQPNGNEQVPNYIVLKDSTTNPVTFQIYLHLAQDSIPVELRTPGVLVQQGQFLGLADDTGQSSGNHLHFQVVTGLTSPSWGQSVDITFDDVAINGGRPRIAQDLPYCHSSDVCLQTQNTYISGNVTVGDRTPPRGDITAPAQDGMNLSSSHLQISGWAADDDPGLLSAQIVAGYAGTWHDLAAPFSSSPFSLDWDLCAGNVPDGPVSLALRMLDKNGNQVTTYDGARRFFKSYACPAPPPACQPASNQVAIFAGTDFQGACSLLNSGDYENGASLGSVGDNQVNSVQVGSSVQATLFSDANFASRGETILADDANLADNRIGGDTVTSAKVQARGGARPPRPVFPAQDASNNGQYVILAWENGGGDLEYQAKWTKNSQTITGTWQADPAWSLGPLPAGSYSWQVRARQGANQSAWSDPSSFTVTPGSASPSNASAVTAPYIDTMESNSWPHTNNWDLTTAQKHGGSASYGYEPAGQSNYDTGVPNAGDLTSPPIQITGSGYYLRFWYRYETESSGKYWDKRQVLISADNGASFQALLQLSDDPQDYWVQSPAIDLGAYTNKTVLVRFHFETVDARNNAYKGWYIDDFSISALTQPACSDNNDNPGQATSISYGSLVTGLICPAGDIDFYKFVGKSGDPVGIGVQALPTNGYTLDPYLYLLAEDGQSVLTENDDIVPLEQKDSFVSYRLPRDGTYFIKVKAWDHPGAGSLDARYQLSLGSDSRLPSISLTQPVGGTYLPPSAFDLAASASDAGSGLNRVDFYWHDQDWSNPAWTYLGSDRDGSDGWQMKFNSQALPDQKNIAFYAQAVDNAGNTAFAGAYGTALDRTPPVTTLQLASPVISTTAAVLAWSGSDNISGVDYFDVQMRQISGSTWSNWADLWTRIPSTQGQKWYIGDLNGQYQFRVRGVDRLGNSENYPTTAQASFTVAPNPCKADAYETDNDPASALTVTAEAVQIHNFCNPLPASNWKDDQDWLRIPMKAGQFLIIEALPQSPSTAIVLELYGSQASSGPLLAKSQSQVFGQATTLIWSASQDDSYTLRMRHPDGRVLGSGVQYQVKVRITNAAPVWLPVLMSLR
jgi:murein DD-endopeptidase MepM/ murein hydrolase activator NlpD